MPSLSFEGEEQSRNSRFDIGNDNECQESIKKFDGNSNALALSYTSEISLIQTQTKL